jgi:hypothetical protein
LKAFHRLGDPVAVVGIGCKQLPQRALLTHGSLPFRRSLRYQRLVWRHSNRHQYGYDAWLLSATKTSGRPPAAPVYASYDGLLQERFSPAQSYEKTSLCCA